MNPQNFDQPKIFIAPGAKMPERATEGSAGYDLFAKSNQTIPANSRILVGTGVYIKLPEGIYAQVCSRSGLALNRGICVLNAPGIIDNDYRGELGVILFNTSNVDVEIHSGDKIAQLVLAQMVTFTPGYPVKVKSLNELGFTSRGSGGFGSSDITKN